MNWIDYHHNKYDLKIKTNIDNLSPKELEKIRLEAYSVSTGLLEKYIYSPVDPFIKFTLDDKKNV